LTTTLDPIVVEAVSAIAGPTRPMAGHGRSSRLEWTAVTATVFVAAWGSGIGRRAIVNPGGWPLLRRFWTAAWSPDFSRAALQQTIGAVRTTVAYAVLGTLAGLAFGVVGALGVSRRAMGRRLGRDHTAPHNRAVQLLLIVPRGIHEAVWALVLLSVLGRDPMVAILAIALPYGAITAKVFADIVDDASDQGHRLLRSFGGRRLPALLYAAVPACGGDLVSYAFYRFECALRSAVVLGMVGVGGIGFELSQSFQGLAYHRLWTSLYTLLVLGVAAEGWGAHVRRAGGRRRARHGRQRAERRAVGRSTLLLGVVLAILSWIELRPGVGVLFGGRTRGRVARWAGDSWPPRLPKHGWTELARSAVATAHLSLLAIVVATLIAVPMAVAGARTQRRRATTRALSKLARGVALALRSVPAPVWALLALFVLLPGVVPGAVALGLYTAGVLARLFGEAIENADRRAEERLVAGGAGRVVGFSYATLPGLTSRWTTFALYRWEVAARDAAVVGAIGTAGLGRLLTEQTAAFAFHRILTTVAALVVLTSLIDVGSNLTRRLMR
jgi:phosphonate transport system permease protein